MAELGYRASVIRGLWRFTPSYQKRKPPEVAGGFAICSALSVGRVIQTGFVGGPAASRRRRNRDVTARGDGVDASACKGHPHPGERICRGPVIVRAKIIRARRDAHERACSFVRDLRANWRF